MNPGCVYILTNPAHPGLLKIGQTTKDPLDRASDISRGTGVVEPFEVAHSKEVSDCVRAEAIVHRDLSHCRKNDKREFFGLSLSDAKATVHSACEKINEESAQYKLPKAMEELKLRDNEICKLRASRDSAMAVSHRAGGWAS